MTSGPADRPPWLAQKILSIFVHPVFRDQQVGDLCEEYEERSLRSGRGAARRWFWRQAIRSAAPNLGLRLRTRPIRTSRRAGAIETLGQDLRYGLRALRNGPGFAVVSITTLALAICVNTAVFSAVNAAVFADLPMEDPDRIAPFFSTNQRLAIQRGGFTPRELLTYRENSLSFEGLAAWRADQWVLAGETEPMRVGGYQITENFLRVWGMPTVLGRPFLQDETVPGAPRVAILSHGFWTRVFGASQSVLGSTINLDGIEHTVVGVLSPEMEWATLAEVEIWVPLTLDRGVPSFDSRSLAILGRLREGVTVERADAEIKEIAANAAAEWSDRYEGWEPAVFLTVDTLLDDDDERVLLLLVLAVGFVLLIACANIGNILLARATTRARELAVRAALGAARTRLIRQMLTESCLIGVTASAAGLLLSRGLMRTLIWLNEGQSRIYEYAVVDRNVLLFTLIIALVTPLVFGLLPALRASTLHLADSLNNRSTHTGSGSGYKLRGLLVTTQVSLALMLLIVAGLVVRSVTNELRREYGFETTNVLTFRIDLPEARYADNDRRVRFIDEATRRVRQLPDVLGVALVSRIPLIEDVTATPFDTEAGVTASDAARPSAVMRRVSADFFDVLGIPVLAGRSFSSGDSPDTERVAVVSREIARRYWGESDVVGGRIAIGNAEARRWLRVVGIVGDVAKVDGGLEQSPAIYLPYAQGAGSRTAVLVRTARNPLSLVDAVRSRVWEVDANLPIDRITSIEQALHFAWARTRTVVALFVALALFALLMAAVGIYGVMSYAVSSRAGEICIRMALGAGAGSVRTMMLRQGLRLLFLGTAVGLAGALGLSRLLASLVVGISSVDPVTFVGVPAVLAAVGIAANYLPVYRASRVDPVAGLRLE